jgi:hypothetical protein
MGNKKKKCFCQICDVWVYEDTDSGTCQHWGKSELITCENCDKQYLKGWAHGCESEFKKHDQNKPNWDDLPWEIVEMWVKVLDYGAQKYGRRNWQNCKSEDLYRYSSAMIRHYKAWKTGEKLDPESGLPHLAHVITNAGFLIWFDINASHNK